MAAPRKTISKFKIQDREHLILRFLMISRFLTSNQIKDLFRFNGKYDLQGKTDSKMRGLENNLRKLADKSRAGLLLAFKTSVDEPNVYHLSQKGVEYCRAMFCKTKGELKFYAQSKNVKHYLAEADCYVTLTTLQATKRIKKIIRYGIELGTWGKVPDILFEVVLDDDSHTLGFIEIDRNTETVEFILKHHLFKYHHLYLEKQVEKDLGIFPIVYFLTTSELRKKSLIAKFKPFEKKFSKLNVVVYTMEEFHKNTLTILGG